MNDERIKLSESGADELVNVAVPDVSVIHRATLLEIVDDLLFNGRKIYAVKIVRTVTGHGLLMSKAIVDIREEKMRIRKERDVRIDSLDWPT